MKKSFYSFMTILSILHALENQCMFRRFGTRTTTKQLSRKIATYQVPQLHVTNMPYIQHQAIKLPQITLPKIPVIKFQKTPSYQQFMQTINAESERLAHEAMLQIFKAIPEKPLLTINPVKMEQYLIKHYFNNNQLAYLEYKQKLISEFRGKLLFRSMEHNLLDALATTGLTPEEQDLYKHFIDHKRAGHETFYLDELGYQVYKKLKTRQAAQNLAKDPKLTIKDSDSLIPKITLLPQEHIEKLLSSQKVMQAMKEHDDPIIYEYQKASKTLETPMPE